MPGNARGPLSRCQIPTATARWQWFIFLFSFTIKLVRAGPANSWRVTGPEHDRPVYNILLPVLLPRNSGGGPLLSSRLGWTWGENFSYAPYRAAPEVRGFSRCPHVPIDAATSLASYGFFFFPRPYSLTPCGMARFIWLEHYGSTIDTTENLLMKVMRGCVAKISVLNR